jgi:ABC-type thiamine transport system ATPase subunit
MDTLLCCLAKDFSFKKEPTRFLLDVCKHQIRTIGLVTHNCDDLSVKFVPRVYNTAKKRPAG